MAKKCSFCREEGHNIRCCKAPGAAEVRERRDQDPKRVEKSAKDKQKKEEKSLEEKEKLNMSTTRKVLSCPQFHFWESQD